MARNYSGNIRKYRRPLNINLGMIIFGCIFIYILICVAMYFTTRHVAGYEVKTGSLSVNNVFTGLAIRDEEIVTSNSSGYINYYAREGGRVAVGNLVYTVDETGQFSQQISSEHGTETSLSDEDFNELKSEIHAFTSTFEPKNFHMVYDFKYNVQGTVMKLANYNILGDIDAAGAGNVDFCRAAKTGIVIYSVDGYEAKPIDQISEEDYNLENYNKIPLISNELVNRGDPAYKLCLNENWSIVIPVTQERADKLQEAEYVKVKFLKNQNTSWGHVFIHQNPDGVYAELRFNNSMISFCTDRYIDIELITEEANGLKIPNSAIIEREFFLIPEAYLTKGGANGREGVLRESYTEDGQATTEFIETTVYSFDSDNKLYYVDDSQLRIGDYIIKPNSTDKEAVSRRGTLMGVYNINKGYAEFRQVHILEHNGMLYQNDEYSLVQPNTMYGLSVYDYIALDAESVTEDELISSNDVEKKFLQSSDTQEQEETESP